MGSVIDLLDGPSARRDGRHWTGEVARSLRENAGAWLLAADRGDLSPARAWVLLSWVERTASEVVVSRRPELVEAAAMAMSLLESSELDRRDVMVVASLVRRAAILARLEFLRLVAAGCGRAGVWGERCARWLSKVSPDTPSTHIEVGAGGDFRFQRVPPGDRRQAADAVGGGRTPSGTDDARFADTPPDREVRPWPKPVRYVLGLGLVALAGVGVVTLLYSQGILAIAGPFVAAVVGPVVVLVGLLWRHRRTMRRERGLVESLRGWLLELERERVLAPAARSTSASDRSLDTAVHTVTTALQQFERGHTSTGAATVEALAGQFGDWSRRAEITRGIRAAATSARRLRKTLNRGVG